MGVTNFILELLEAYNEFILTLPSPAQSFINLFLLVMIIFLYSFFIWKFYKFISEKNIFELNLNQYNKAEHPFFTKLIASLLYLAEYIFLLPFLVFIWFAVFTFFLVILTQEGVEISTILLISATVIGAIRMAAYYKKALSEEVAKILPFTLLAISVLNPNFFSGEFITRISTRLSGISAFFHDIVIYLLFIIVLEIILRFFEFIFSLFGLEEAEIKKIQEKQEES